MSPEPELVRLVVPASGEHLRLARLVVAGMASQWGASVEDVEDLRLAVGEICAHLATVAPSGARMCMEAVASDSGLTVRVTAPSVVPPPALDELAAVLLTTVTDDHGTEEGPSSSTLWFSRRLVGPLGAT